MGFAIHLCSAFSKRTRGSHFIPLKHTLTHTHTHSKGLATGVQPCSAVETKHWPVLTGGDPCFRVERSQKRINGSHPEGDVYRKILLAGILLFLILDLKSRVTVMAEPGQSVPQVIMKRMWMCISSHTHTRFILKCLFWPLIFTVTCICPTPMSL